MEGPFYLDQGRIREAISEGKPGVPLQLILRVLEASASCAPIPKAAVDVWQCDALGIYSGYEVTNAVYARAPYDRHPNRDTTNATDRFLGPITDKSLVMWTMTRDGDGYVAAATVALRTS